MSNIASKITLFLSILLASCSGDELSCESSTSQSSDAKLYELNLALPPFDKFSELSGYDTAVATFVGVEDHEEYLVTMSVESDGEVTTLQALSSGDLSQMPLQRYYFNTITYGEQTKSESLQSRTLGAILSAEDPDNIYYISSFDTRSERVGGGTEKDPYTISSVSDLAEDMLYNMAEAAYFGEEDVYEGVYFLQTANIDLGVYDGATTFTGSWTPLGAPITILSGDGVAFRGTYDGGGFYIHNLNSDVQRSLGFFYKLGDGAVVKSLNFVGISFSGGEAVAAVAAYSSGDVTIEDISLSGYIRATDYMGGFIAYATSDDGAGGTLRFSGCSNNLSLSFNDNAYTTGAVTDHYVEFTGGFVAYTDGVDCDFEYCSYNGVASGDYLYLVGGFVGGSRNIPSRFDFKYCGIAGVLGGVCCHMGGYIGMLKCDDESVIVECDITFDAAKVGGVYLKDNYGEYQYVERDFVLLQKELNNGGYIGGFIGLIVTPEGDSNRVTIDMTSSNDDYGNCAVSSKTAFRRIIEDGTTSYGNCLAGLFGCLTSYYGDGVKAGSVVDFAATFDLDGYNNHASMLMSRVCNVGAYMTVNILDGCSGYESMTAMVVEFAVDTEGANYLESDIQINNYLGGDANFPTTIGSSASDSFSSSYVTITNK